MPEESRTFKVDDPHQTGKDVEAWQETLLRQFKTWNIDYPLVVDSDYGVICRDATATVLYGLGIARDEMAQGVTSELRVKVRNKRLTDEERKRFHDREEWRDRLRMKHENGGRVASPLAVILSNSWGWHPPVHDGVDLICRPNATGFAICDGTIVRADSGGWWGKGAPSAAVAAKGDGIVVLRCTVECGPFKKGLNFCYGHAEHPRVRVGQKVQAGEDICSAGMANAWHFHMCVNDRNDAKGVGDRDPMPYITYALTHS